MNKFVAAVAAGIFGLLSAGAAQANGITLCFTNSVNNVALLGQLSGVENGIVIRNASGGVVTAADNYYGTSTTVSAFWTVALPTSVTLPSGCSTFYFMNKTTSPNANSAWACNSPTISAGSVDNNNVQNTIISGGMGASMVSGAVVIPATPNAAPVIVQGCSVN